MKKIPKRLIKTCAGFCLVVVVFFLGYKLITNEVRAKVKNTEVAKRPLADLKEMLKEIKEMIDEKGDYDKLLQDFRVKNYQPLEGINLEGIYDKQIKNKLENDEAYKQKKDHLLLIQRNLFDNNLRGEWSKTKEEKERDEKKLIEFKEKNSKKVFFLQSHQQFDQFFSANCESLLTKGDGNCFLHAISILLTGQNSIATTLLLRIAVVKEIIENFDKYKFIHQARGEIAVYFKDETEPEGKLNSGQKKEVIKRYIEINKLLINRGWLFSDSCTIFLAEILKRPIFLWSIQETKEYLYSKKYNKKHLTKEMEEYLNPEKYKKMLIKSGASQYPLKERKNDKRPWNLWSIAYDPSQPSNLNHFEAILFSEEKYLGDIIITEETTDGKILERFEKNDEYKT